jgi:N-acyl amino acid synthase of PEP-CTERM/exosortase system
MIRSAQQSMNKLTYNSPLALPGASAEGAAKSRLTLAHSSPAVVEKAPRPRFPGLSEISTMFGDYFDVIDADTEKLREDVFKLRYQVYCVETKFENAADFPNEMEIDEYDERSVHSILRHKRSGIDAGTVRLVLPEGGNLSSLPLHEVIDDPFFRDYSRFDPSKVAEVSRFAISKSFRRRLGEYPSPSASGPYDPEREKRYHEQQNKVLPHITLGLFVAMVRMSYELGITTWFCVMEKALVRLLARYSLHFIPVGPVVEYHGKRQPCYANVEEFLDRVRQEQPEIWKLITDNGRSLVSRKY